MSTKQTRFAEDTMDRPNPLGQSMTNTRAIVHNNIAQPGTKIDKNTGKPRVPVGSEKLDEDGKVIGYTGDFRLLGINKDSPWGGKKSRKGRRKRSRRNSRRRGSRNRTLKNR
jgi:hypothetical protein